MLVGDALEVALALEGVEAVQRRLVGGDLTAGLNLSDQGGLAVLGVEVLDELERSLLLMGQEIFRQRGVQR